MNDLIAKFERMLARGKDSSLLRYSLGNEYMKVKDVANAVLHLEAALEADPGYSAAWKLYGKTLTEAGRPGDAIVAYRSGIEAADSKGDLQAAKEMRVFLRRLEKAANAAS